MIYISHLIEDEKMKALTARTGAGIESIEFSVAENLDDFEGADEKLQKASGIYELPGAYPSWAVSRPESYGL